MYESWVEKIEQVICHILFKNITKLHSLLVYEFEIDR
jgi:hypothetical protein